MKVQHRSLREVFEGIADESRKDPIRHLAALTYEFDDEQLVNLLVGRPLDETYEPRGFDLKRIAELSPVVAYDARKTREGQATPHFMELLPVAMPAYTCHHPKAILVVLSKAVHLVIGSMNLTRTGLLSNREVFLHVRCGPKDTGDVPLVRQFVDVLETAYADFHSQPLLAAIAGARERLAAWPASAAATRFLVASGYGATGLSRLRALWSADGRASVKAVLAISPFFDRGSAQQMFSDALREEFGAFEELTVVTDAATRQELSRRHFGGANASALRLIQPELAPSELTRIARANDLSDLGQRVVQRKLHAKVLALHDGARTLLYMGSANFTCKAWLGGNRELGVAWFDDQPWPALVAQLCAGVSTDPENCFHTVGERPLLEREQEEDYEGAPTWPTFVQSIALEFTPGRQSLRFVVQASDAQLLDQYTICWGAEQLTFANGISGPVAVATLFGRLLGGRNLSFRPLAAPETVHWLPFRHDTELFAERESLVYASAEEWMAYALGLERALPLHPNEVDPDAKQSSDAPAPPARPIVSRLDNPVVRMQAYLSLFDRAARQVVDQGRQVLRLAPEEQGAAWEARVTIPLRSLARILARTADTMTEAEAVFKLGELLDLARELAHMARPHHVVPDPWADWPVVPKDPWLRDYLAEWRTGNAPGV